VAQLPPDLVRDGGWIMRRGQPGGLRRVGYAARMGCHVGHGRRVTCGPGSGYCGPVADLPSRRVRPGRQGADATLRAAAMSNPTAHRRPNTRRAGISR
jgi:hypothetical protein